MKKVFLIVVFLFLFIFNFKIFAQENSFLVPGVNCGIAGDVKTSKCCAPITTGDITKSFLTPPDYGAPFRVLRDLILGPGFDFIKTWANPIQDFQTKMNIPCQSGIQSTSDVTDPNCRCVLGTTPTPGPLNVLNQFCKNQTSAGDQSSCSACISQGGVWSGIGCVQGTIDKFIGETVFGMGIGLAGGFSLLCIIYAAFMMQSSQGNPEKLKKAQEMITSCIMGLMLIIFSVLILRIIGVEILKIPGFS